MTTVMKIEEDDFDAEVDVAVALLKSGGLIVYPTDTLYGIGGDATNEEVVNKILKIKGIKARRPMSVMVSDFGMIDYYCETGIWEDIILKKYLPGPYTFVLKKSRYLAASETGKIGIRIPESAFCQALCQEFGRPIITTSANFTGAEPPVKFEDIDKKLLDLVGIGIDGGPTKYQGPSVVIDLVERKLLREGAKDGIDILELPEP